MNLSIRLTRKVTCLIAVIIAVSWAIFPFIWAFTCSIKQPRDQLGLKLIPLLQYEPTIRNWVTEFQQRGPEIKQGLINSTIVATGTSLLTLIIGLMAAYALVRSKFSKIKNQDIAIWFLSQRILPPVVVAIPFFLMMKTLRLIDSRLALILANTTFNLPFAVLIIRSIIVEIPEEIEESALIDGCSKLSALIRIVLPLSIPGLIAAGVVVFAFTWNEFLFALVLAYGQAQTMPVVIAGATSIRGIEFWYISIRTLLAIVPPVILAILIQRWIVRGLTFGAVKG